MSLVVAKEPEDVTVPEMGESINEAVILRCLQAVSANTCVLAALPAHALLILEFAREHGRVTMGEAIKLTGASRNTLKQHCIMGNDYYVTNEHRVRLNGHVEASGEVAHVIPISSKIESELAELGDEERSEFLSSLGLEEPGLHTLIRAGYRLPTSRRGLVDVGPLTVTLTDPFGLVSSSRGPGVISAWTNSMTAGENSG